MALQPPFDQAVKPIINLFSNFSDKLNGLQDKLSDTLNQMQSKVNDLPDNVDVCGENGEFHSFVYDGPIFKKPIPIIVGEIVKKEYKSDENSDWDNAFWYADLELSTLIF